jgi:hypothetical protein
MAAPAQCRLAHLADDFLGIAVERRLQCFALAPAPQRASGGFSARSEFVIKVDKTSEE